MSAEDLFESRRLERGKINAPAKRHVLTFLNPGCQPTCGEPPEALPTPFGNA